MFLQRGHAARGHLLLVTDGIVAARVSAMGAVELRIPQHCPACTLPQDQGYPQQQGVLAHGALEQVEGAWTVGRRRRAVPACQAERVQFTVQPESQFVVQAGSKVRSLRVSAQADEWAEQQERRGDQACEACRLAVGECDAGVVTALRHRDAKGSAAPSSA